MYQQFSNITSNYERPLRDLAMHKKHTCALVQVTHLQYIIVHNLQIIIIIIQIIQKICSAHISTLLGAQGANPESHKYKHT